MRVLSLFGAFKRALMALLGRALFSEIEHDERLREVESRLQAERNAGNEVTARYLERCLQDAVSDGAVRKCPRLRRLTRFRRPTVRRRERERFSSGTSRRRRSTADTPRKKAPGTRSTLVSPSL
jgi:hypothetical protein